MDKIQITDVTLRDGLQIEPIVYPLALKQKLFEQLTKCQYSRIEVTSFVHPKWVPQFSDCDSFCTWLEKRPEIKNCMAFVPNEKGLERFLKFSIPWVSCFIAVSKTFNQKNINTSQEDTLLELKKMVQAAHLAKRKIRLYLSTVFGCPYEGAIEIDQVKEVFSQMAEFKPDEIALSDTIGVAVPSQVKRTLEMASKYFPVEKTALHFHNTYGMALSCLEEGYKNGIRLFDGSTGGVGGCPYAKGATGNVATEDVLYAFYRQGYSSSFPDKNIIGSFEILKNDFKVKCHSRLFDIWEKGGGWHGIE